MDESILSRLRASWESDGARPRPGIARHELLTQERRLGRTISPIVASLYSTTNGTEECDRALFVTWPLAEMGSVPGVVATFGGIPDYRNIVNVLPDAGDYFAFGDYMIWSHVLAVRLRQSSETEVIWICGDAYAVVAPTFDAFWRRYLEDPERAIWPSESVHG